MRSLSDSEIRSSFTARALRRNRKILLIIAIPAPLMTIVMGASAAATLEIQFFAAAAAAALAAFFSIRAFVRGRDVTRSPLVRLLRDRPDQIVWIYLRRDVVTGLGANETVYVRGASGQIFVLASLEAPQLLAELAAWCPHAHVGWSRALDEAWTRHAASLRRGAA